MDAACPFCGRSAMQKHHVFSRARFPRLKNEKTNLLPMCGECHIERYHRQKTIYINGVSYPPISKQEIMEAAEKYYGPGWKHHLMAVNKEKPIRRERKQKEYRYASSIGIVTVYAYTQRQAYTKAFRHYGPIRRAS